MSKSIVDAPPGKALRLGLRLGIWLAARQSFLITNPHQVVIETIGHDKDTDTYFVVSGWGKTSEKICGS